MVSTNQSAIRKLLRQPDIESVRQGLELATALGDDVFWQELAEGLLLVSHPDEPTRFTVPSGCAVFKRVKQRHRYGVALEALVQSGRLAGVTKLNLSGTSIHDLYGLVQRTSLTSLDLTECSALKSLAGIENLTALTSLKIANCKTLTFAATRGGSDAGWQLMTRRGPAHPADVDRDG